MTPKQVEKLAAAAHAAVAAHRSLPELTRDLTKLGEVLREVDPAGIYNPAGSLAFRAGGTAEPPEPTLRECPRLKRLDEASVHD